MNMNLIEVLVNEYDEKNWENYASLFEDADKRIEGIPQDVVNVVFGVLGDKTGYSWLLMPFDVFDGKTASDLLKSPEGAKALKAFIMRLPI